MEEPASPFVFLHSTQRIIQGWGAVEKLADLARERAARRAAIVADAFFAGTPSLGRIARSLETAIGSHPAVHAIAPHEPDIASVEACRETLARTDPDLVVAVGGGSAMDTAKIARMLLANPGPVEAIAGFGKTLHAHRSLFVCIPTTAGTGSEVSDSAIAGKHGADAKLIYRSPEMAAQIALLDPELTLSAPPSVTAYSGYDAVTHAVEAYVSRASSVMTDSFALIAMQLLGRYLPIAYEQPGNRAARSWCLIASCQAAVAFNSANLGLAHAISGPLGALHHVPHGLGNALALPAVTAFNEPALGEKGAMIARAFGGATAASALAALRERLGLDRGLDEFVSDGAARETLAAAAMRSGQVRMNPRAATLEDMRSILEAMRRPLRKAAPVLPS
jgi:alcohol dehydrogenase class IV